MRLLAAALAISVPTVATAQSAPGSYTLRLFNVDDQFTATIGGQTYSASYGQNKTFDISGSMSSGWNPISFSLTNTGGGYTYGYDVSGYGKSQISGSCGTAGVIGCDNNSQTPGTVYTYSSQIYGAPPPATLLQTIGEVIVTTAALFVATTALVPIAIVGTVFSLLSSGEQPKTPRNRNGGGGVRGSVSIPVFDLIEQSPDAVGFDVIIPADATQLGFDYFIDNVGDGDWLSVLIDGQPVWSQQASALGAREGSGFGTFDASRFAGKQVNLTYLLSSTGQANARFSVGSSVFSVSSANSGAVPEPSSWAMMLLGFGAIAYSMRRRRRFPGSLQTA